MALRDPSAATPARLGGVPRALLAIQVAGSLGLAAGGTAGVLLVEHVSGSGTLGAVPLGLLVAGSALSAPVVTAVMRGRSRVAGLVLSYTVAAAGAWLVVAASIVDGLFPLLLGSFLLGTGNTAVMLGRYVAADTVPRERIGAAVSSALAAVTFGAVAGPALLGPAGEIAALVGLPAPAGLYLLAGAIFPLAAALCALLHVPAVPDRRAVDGDRTQRRHCGGAAVLPIVVLGSTNLVMVVVMAVMPASLHAHHWPLGSIGLLVAAHIGAMYAPAPLSGRLQHRVGSVRTALYGAAVLVAAVGVTGFAAHSGHGVASVLGLVLLGVGWNLQLVAGTALLVERTPAHLRSRAEGTGELAMGVAAAIGTLGLAAPLIALGGVPLLCAATAVPAVAVGAVLLRELRHTGRPAFEE